MIVWEGEENDDSIACVFRQYLRQLNLNVKLNG